MTDDVAVNHPSHYEKGDGHIECIDLLDLLTAGYKGIYAMEVGQAKYLYRAGSKGEADLTQKEKTIQDVKKFLWYVNNLYSKVSSRGNQSPGVSFEELVYDGGKMKFYNPVISQMLQNEFTYDKPDCIKNDIKVVIDLIYRLTSLSEIKEVAVKLQRIITTLEGSEVTFVNI